jgi:hypothetical protein
MIRLGSWSFASGAGALPVGDANAGTATDNSAPLAIPTNSVFALIITELPVLALAVISAALSVPKQANV